jgi:hypothetical protein
MKQQDVFNKIGGIIKELNDQYKYLESNPADLNELELELFVANAHFLADHAEILNKINAQNNLKPAEAAEPPRQQEKYFEPVVAHAEPDFVPQIDLATNAPADTYAYERQQPEIIRHELVIDESGMTGDEEDEHAEYEIIEEETIEPEPVVESFITPEPVIAEVKAPAVSEPEEVLTINQKMSARYESAGTLTGQVSAQPVTDLKQAITLNDKLLYIKDLFNGYSLAYSEAIDILNRFNSFEEADNFLKKNYTPKNNWEAKPETTEKFYALLKRRYN